MKGIIITIAFFGICSANAQIESNVEQYIKLLDHKDSTIVVATNHLKNAVINFWENSAAVGIADTQTVRKLVTEIKSESSIEFYESFLYDTIVVSKSEIDLLKSIDDFSDVTNLYIKSGVLIFADSLLMVSTIESIEESVLVLLSEIDYIMEKIRSEFDILENPGESEVAMRSLVMVTIYQSEAEIVKSYIDKILLVNDKIIAMTE